MGMRAVGIDTGGTWTRIMSDDELVSKLRTPQAKQDYLSIISEHRALLDGAFLVDAVAGPVAEDGSSVKISNQDWGLLTTDEIREASGAGEVRLVNDLVGVGAGVVHVRKTQPERIIYVAGDSMPRGYHLVVAPGTGIGVAKIAPDGEVLSGEGGWVLAQLDGDEMEVLERKSVDVAVGRYVACEDVAGNPSLYGLWYKETMMILETSKEQMLARKARDAIESARASDKSEKIAEFAKRGDKLCLYVMRQAAKFLGQCAQSNMLSPPMARALCIVGSFENDMEVLGYTDELLEHLRCSRHRGMLEEAPVYTVRNSGELGAKGALALARKYAGH